MTVWTAQRHNKQHPASIKDNRTSAGIDLEIKTQDAHRVEKQVGASVEAPLVNGGNNTERVIAFKQTNQCS